jgi:hypothetical protein
VFLPDRLAEFNEQWVWVLLVDLAAPEPGDLIVHDDLSLQNLVVGVSCLALLVFLPVHFVLVYLVELWPFETVVQVDAVHVVLLDDGEDLCDQQVPGLFLAVV